MSTDVVTITTVDGVTRTVTLKTGEDRKRVADWIRTLGTMVSSRDVPIEVRVRGIDDLSDTELASKFIRSPPVRFWSRLRSGAWGVTEGAVTGMITASNSSGGGQWIFGTISQVVGSTIGLVVGGAVFGVLGFVSDVDTIRTILVHYRMSFSTNKRNRVPCKNGGGVPRLPLNPIRLLNV
ncbi:19.3 kDa [Spodoptera frugiperda ascovirus 1a]|uniref:19.3 kDa n=1 Tax=Spodoptera frugiperda ascovirus 1a TaxID=113370 RepID=Q0E4Y2_SFAVA|nr:19.3 kDa [Spodoptera frugiperda ascovirus 1a]CAL44719.2 19.3 kDa [Spodoptera frugiperda ascovirus 1a]